MSYRLYVVILTVCVQGVYGVSDFELEGRIVNGYKVDIYRYPHSAFLSFEQSLPTGCGGSIINAYAIITAAHCLAELTHPKGNITAFLGSTVPQEAQAVRYISQYRTHPDFNPTKGRFNLGLAYVNKSMTFGRNIQKIPIALKAPRVNDFLYTSGWGKQVPKKLPDYSEMRHLKASKQKVISSNQCEKYTGFHISSAFWCTVAVNGYHYNGDDGNGLVTKNNFLVGVVSYMINDATIYSDVILQQKWIKRALKSLVKEYCAG